MAVRMVAEQDAGSLSGVYAEIRRMLGLGLVPNVFKAMAAISPDVLLQNWTAFRRTFLEGELPRALKEMIGLVVARESGCDYSLHLHVSSLLVLGTERDTVSHLAAQGEWAGLSGRTSAVLRFARRSWENPAHALTEPLEAEGLTEDEAQEVIDTLFIVVGLNRFAAESAMPLDLQIAL
jgi:AhpD family alkylhydroperoxidase